MSMTYHAAGLMHAHVSALSLVRFMMVHDVSCQLNKKLRGEKNKACVANVHAFGLGRVFKQCASQVCEYSGRYFYVRPKPIEPWHQLHLKTSNDLGFWHLDAFGRFQKGPIIVRA